MVRTWAKVYYIIHSKVEIKIYTKVIEKRVARNKYDNLLLCKKNLNRITFKNYKKNPDNLNYRDL